MTAILVAENNTGHLDHLSSIVKSSGFSVLRATNPEQAKAILGSQRADVAVLDLRLEDDTDEHDITGLEVARKTDDMIPKIIVSKFANKSDLADALKINIKGSPAIVEFVEMKKVATDLIPAIENAVRVRQTWSAMSKSKVSSQLDHDYKNARKDARLHYWVSFGISIGFALLIFIGAFYLHVGGTPSNGSMLERNLPILFAVMGVLVAEITNYLFGRKLEFLYKRVERFHSELLQTNRFEQLLDSSYAIRDEKSREEFKKTLFDAAASEWLHKQRSDSELREDREKRATAPEPVSSKMIS